MKNQQVFVEKCTGYSDVDEVVKRLIASLGGPQAFVKPGGTVLLKPNMLSCKTPDHAATTHPAIVTAVAKIFVNFGCRVLIGDSPPAVFGRTEQFWQKTGFQQAAIDSGAELLCFETMPKQEIEIKTNGSLQKVHIVKAFFSADLVINLPKLKTHNLTRLTLAIKNLFGLVPGLSKAIWHKIYPKSLEFSNFITDLAFNLPVKLNILDAVEGMDGQGPAGGRKIFPGFVMASTCPVSIDRAVCALGGIDEDSIAVLRRAAELNWGPESFAAIDYNGPPVTELRLRDFNVPAAPIQDRVPDFILNHLKKLVWAGPGLKKNICIKCGRCEKICPVKAINITDTGAAFDRSVCISCFCCMEVCPVDAIEAEKSPLLQLVWRLRQLKKRLRKP